MLSPHLTHTLVADRHRSLRAAAHADRRLRTARARSRAARTGCGAATRGGAPVPSTHTPAGGALASLWRRVACRNAGLEATSAA